MNTFPNVGLSDPSLHLVELSCADFSFVCSHGTCALRKCVPGQTMDDLLMLGVFLTLVNIAYGLASFFGYSKEQPAAKSVAHVRAQTFHALWTNFF
jgi:hypothetical protein